MGTAANTLYYGDNLDIMRRYLADGCADLVYLDPPFNSNRSYNVLYRDESGVAADAQITAFDDTWHWGEAAEATYQDLVTAGGPVSSLLSALRQAIGTNQMMAYLVMMAARLAELHRVLKPTGSLYLHCDPSASHYLKVLLDAVFGADNFQNEIVWSYRRWTGAAKSFLKMHDILLFYTKTSTYTFNRQFTAYTDASLKRKQHYHTRIKGDDVYVTHVDERGVGENDVWHIQLLNSQSKERLGYPTQKPVALLERIIAASSSPGDLVLDPFCECGTTVHAAQQLGRQWIGIDITHLSVALLKYRLRDAFGLEEGEDYQVMGEPMDLASARQLAEDDRYQFQWWALSLIHARPFGAAAGGGAATGTRTGKKGADKGIDGVITFIDDRSGTAKRALVQVKSGHVTANAVRDLRGTVEREQAQIGVLVTLEEPSGPMQTEAVSAGFYHSDGWNKDYPRLQIVSVKELLAGTELRLPPAATTFRQAEKATRKAGETQGSLFEGAAPGHSLAAYGDDVEP